MNLLNLNQSIFDKFNIYTLAFREASFEKKFITEMILLIAIILYPLYTTL